MAEHGITRADTAPEMATRLGHCVSWDPPHGLSRVERWTCSNCGAAVLKHSTNIYGSAVQSVCDIGGRS